MNETPMHAETAPWYRQPWPWLLMLGPAIVIVAGFVTLWLAIKSSDGLVADDYYKQGLAINQTLARGDRARALDLGARLEIGAQSLRVTLTARQGVALPQHLLLAFIHPTRGGMDHTLELKGSAGTYLGAMPSLALGRWQVLLEDVDHTWRLSGTAHVPDDREVALGAKIPHSLK